MLSLLQGGMEESCALVVPSGLARSLFLGSLLVSDPHLFRDMLRMLICNQVRKIFNILDFSAVISGLSAVCASHISTASQMSLQNVGTWS